MGLDISYYRNLKRVGDYDPENDDAEIVISHAPGYADRADNLEEGSYEGEVVGGFRAGSYGGYNAWRNELCRMAHGVEDEVLWKNPDKYAGKAFYELIAMSDCEGTIGPATATKLYKDFVAFEEQAKGRNFYPGIGDDYFYEKYKDWKEAFRVASEENGAVGFH